MARYKIEERKWVTNATTGVGLELKLLHRTHTLVDTHKSDTSALRFMTKGTEAECEKALLLLIAKDTGEANG